MNKNTSRKSICFLTHQIITGGIENVLIEAVKTLHDKYDVEVVSLFDGAEKAVTDAFPTDVTVKIGPFCKNKLFNKGRSRLYLSGFYFNKSLKQNYDYVISLKNLERYACFSNRSKHYIYWCHNDSHTHFMKPNLSKAIKKEKRCTKTLYKKHDMVWMVNDAIVAEAQEVFSAHNIHALPNPLDCNGIMRKATEPCDIVFDKTKTNIVLLGRISAEKGFGRIIQLMHQTLAEKFPNIHIYVIGGGSGQEVLQKKVAELNLNDKITFTGSKTNPYPYLKQADLLISPSKYESFGLVIMEAMLLNIPVIATSTTGAEYVTQKGKYACCVDNNNNSLLNAVTKFLENPQSYNYPKADAHKWAMQHDVSAFSKRLVELLEKCENQ